MNTLYYGDNLNILRRHIKDESVDLVYLDPPSLARTFKRAERVQQEKKDQDIRGFI